jgi:hypothetical protein
MAKARIKITESTSSISAKVLFEVAEQVDKKMRKAAPQINLRVGELIEARIRATPHVKSLISGQLQADFGLNIGEAEEAIESLLFVVKRSVKVNLGIKNRGSLGNSAWSMSVSILPEGFSDVLKGIGTYQSPRSGEFIPWMEWLLTKGTTIIYDDFFVAKGEFRTSRSGFALMFPSGESGKIFRVDPNFAGTADDNFVVNTIASLLPEIGNIMFSYLQ